MRPFRTCHPGLNRAQDDGYRGAGWIAVGFLDATRVFAQVRGEARKKRLGVEQGRMHD